MRYTLWHIPKSQQARRLDIPYSPWHGTPVHDWRQASELFSIMSLNTRLSRQALASSSLSLFNCLASMPPYLLTFLYFQTLLFWGNFHKHTRYQIPKKENTIKHRGVKPYVALSFLPFLNRISEN